MRSIEQHKHVSYNNYVLFNRKRVHLTSYGRNRSHVGWSQQLDLAIISIKYCKQVGLLSGYKCNTVSVNDSLLIQLGETHAVINRKRSHFLVVNVTPQKQSE